MLSSMVSLPKTQRLLLGLFVLLVVDLIWVATSELPKVLTCCCDIWLDSTLSDQVTEADYPTQFKGHIREYLFCV